MQIAFFFLLAGRTVSRIEKRKGRAYPIPACAGTTDSIDARLVRVRKISPGRLQYLVPNARQWPESQQWQGLRQG
ncbi:hypothetical protein ACOXVJ_17840 [Pseudomonas knackmussii]|uniref:hypothetical protein n=1 Tax=Pseudomonas knackmussii TaxID=65741 RepID=UPI003BD3CE26